MFTCRNPNCKGNSNNGKKRGSYKCTKGFRHEGRLLQHISSKIECQKVYEDEGLVMFKGVERTKCYDLRTSIADSYNHNNMKPNSKKFFM